MAPAPCGLYTQTPTCEDSVFDISSSFWLPSVSVIPGPHMAGISNSETRRSGVSDFVWSAGLHPRSGCSAAQWLKEGLQGNSETGTCGCKYRGRSPTVLAVRDLCPFTAMRQATCPNLCLPSLPTARSSRTANIMTGSLCNWRNLRFSCPFCNMSP
jgi:hypothetical protein